MPNFKSYLTGFVLSLFFTILAFVLAMEKLLPAGALLLVLLLIAIVQAAIQLIYFLHLKDAAVWDKGLFWFTAGMIVIIMAGTVWIMHHLNYNMMPGQVEQRMMKMENLYK